MSKCYVLAFDDGSLVGIDNNSGYPFKAYNKNNNDSQSFLSQVKFYSTVQLPLAQQYADMFPGLEVKEFHWETK